MMRSMLTITRRGSSTASWLHAGRYSGGHQPDQPAGPDRAFDLAIVAGVAYGWQMGSSIEIYYAAAARSMSMSWHDFVYGAFDPAGTVSVDKLPGALWVQALSVRLFGVHTWAVALPQVIEGVLTVLVLFRAVRRLAGAEAAIVAAAVLAMRSGGGRPGPGQHFRHAADPPTRPGRRRAGGALRDREPAQE